MVKPESLLLSSSGLELGLLEEAEAGPINGSENTSGEQAGALLFPDVLLRGRRGWDWPAKAPLALRPSSSLETRMKSSEVPPPAHPGSSEEACGARPEEMVSAGTATLHRGLRAGWLSRPGGHLTLHPIWLFHGPDALTRGSGVEPVRPCEPLKPNTCFPRDRSQVPV